MPMDLEPFADIGLTQDLLEALIDEHERLIAPQLDRLWAYYRNPMEQSSALDPQRDPSLRPYRLAQEAGLPARLRSGPRSAIVDDRDRQREIVIENDIAWRIDSLVDFVFGKPVRLVSLAGSEQRRQEIEMILDSVWEESGGIALLQDMGLLGAVFGHVDLILRSDELFEAARRLRTGASPPSPERALELARRLRVELIEARRGIALVDPHDVRRILAYLITVKVQANELEDGPGPGRGARRTIGTLEVISADHRQRFEADELVDESPQPLGRLPIVHIQNASQPLSYEGLSDIEPLIPIQDELNTRLSDRAHRVTMQSFNLYLAKGLDEFGAGGQLRVAPGQVWHTDNEAASVEAFGGDGESPSEDSHVEQLRDAMDKISGVSPVAIGVIRARLGHLSSENALRIALMGVISKTARKRLTYGRGISQMSELMLRALDASGVYRTTPSERRVRLEWEDPLPIDERSRLRGALLKRELGVPQSDVLGELGYAPTDSGIT